MARKEHGIHYIYKTTCNVTNRYYIGMHSTSNLDDGYIGSGLRLRRSIRKYGKENHTREILEYLDTRAALVLREIEIVTKELIADDMCMNLKEGGTGGFSSEEHRLKFIQSVNIGPAQERLKILKENDNDYYLAWCDNVKEGLKRVNFNCKTFEGKLHSAESKQKISDSMRGTGIGENNSQYGTCWITKNGVNKKIKKEDLETNIIDGWVKGRKTVIKL